MAKVADEIAHILLHVNAEDSKALGVAERAQKIRDLVDPLKTDQRERTRKELLLELRETLDVDVKSALNDIDADDNGRPLQFELQEWVGKGHIRR